MTNYPGELAQDAAYQSQIGLWFLPKLAQGLNTNNIIIYYSKMLNI
jgi:hypothetical protein